MDPFIQHLVENISSRFASGKDLLVAFTVFDSQYLPAESDPSHKEHGKDKISRLCQHYGRELEVVEEGKVVKFSPDIDSELVREEWNIYRRFMSTQKEVGKEEVLKSSIYTQMFPNIETTVWF